MVGAVMACPQVTACVLFVPLVSLCRWRKNYNSLLCFPGLQWGWISTSECMFLLQQHVEPLASPLSITSLRTPSVIHPSFFYIRPTVRRFPGSEMSARGWSGTWKRRLGGWRWLIRISAGSPMSWTLPKTITSTQVVCSLPTCIPQRTVNLR